MFPQNTNRFRFRKLGALDFDRVHAYATDKDVSVLLGWIPNTHRRTQEFLEKCFAERIPDPNKPRSTWTFGIAQLDSGLLIGTCRIRVIEPRELGRISLVLHPDHWRKGYGTEALKALLAFGIERLGLHRIEAICSPINVYGERMLVKCGLQREALLRHGRKNQGGGWSNVHLYSYVDEEETSLYQA